MKLSVYRRDAPVGALPYSGATEQRGLVMKFRVEATVRGKGPGGETVAINYVSAGSALAALTAAGMAMEISEDPDAWSELLKVEIVPVES